MRGNDVSRIIGIIIISFLLIVELFKGGYGLKEWAISLGIIIIEAIFILGAKHERRWEKRNNEGANEECPAVSVLNKIVNIYAVITLIAYFTLIFMDREKLANIVCMSWITVYALHTVLMIYYERKNQ